MPQEQHELLDQRHLDQDVAGPDKHEVPQHAAHALLHWKLRAQQQRRQRQHDQRGQQADPHQAEQQRQGAVDLGVRSLGHARQKVRPDIVRLHRIEEERPVVVHR